jgi:hypothetical protein
MELAAFAKRHVFTDDAVRADFATGADPRLWMYYGRRMTHEKTMIFDSRASWSSRFSVAAG